MNPRSKAGREWYTGSHPPDMEAFSCDPERQSVKFIGAIPLDGGHLPAGNGSFTPGITSGASLMAFESHHDMDGHRMAAPVEVPGEAPPRERLRRYLDIVSLGQPD